jgi:hypothetical protein
MAFFNSGQELAKIFTPENQLGYEQQKYFGDGLKAMEAFQADIHQNLVEWAVGGKDTVFYKTKDFFYVFEKTVDDVPVIKMGRFSRSGLHRWDTWMNVHSCSVGKKFLTKHVDKRVELFNEGR